MVGEMDSRNGKKTNGIRQIIKMQEIAEACAHFSGLFLTKELNLLFFLILSAISALLPSLSFFFVGYFHIFIVLSFESRSRVEIHSDVMFQSSSGHVDCSCTRLFVCGYEIDGHVQSLTSVRSINY